MKSSKNIEEIELRLFLEAIFDVYGYDFRHYAKASLQRRLADFMNNYQIDTYLGLADRIVHEKPLFELLLKQLSITVSEMFRDPKFYSALKESLLPILKTYPFIKIWSAGCATGEEAYSLAIMLHEAGMLERATIYATDFNNEALRVAKKGIYSTDFMKKYIDNYNKFGGEKEFSEYYTTKYNAIKVHDFLRDHITFANHNLATDYSFSEMNLILCRNVLIYFDQDLTNKVLSLFCESLCHHGFLCLGTKETLQFSSVADDFEVVNSPMKIYRKVK